jgi:glycosyltransferase involved in cell wall biosynthesis
MKILAMVHNYPPLQNSGAEWMLHEILKYLASQGHEVNVLIPINSIDPYNFEGVNVFRHNFSEAKDYIKGCDIIFTHLDRAGKALNIAHDAKKFYVEIIHNTNRHGILYSKHRDNIAERYIYLIYNSLFTKNAMKYPCPGVIVHPPVDAKRYKVVKRGFKLTLVNLFERKGGLFFQHLARLMPDRDFLGVEGGYGKQEVVNLPNTSYLPHGENMKSVYSQTRILLMPSMYESYGRVAVEAMCSGIPVIATPTEGLKESLGDAGIFCDLIPDKWVEAIKKLDDPEEYKAASRRSTDRYKEISLKTPVEMAGMEQFLKDILTRKV